MPRIHPDGRQSLPLTSFPDRACEREERLHLHVVISRAGGERDFDIVELQPKIGRDPAERAAREPRERHPQFLQRSTTRAPAGPAADDDFED